LTINGNRTSSLYTQKYDYYGIRPVVCVGIYVAGLSSTLYLTSLIELLSITLQELRDKTKENN
jgi:hypothetical protein